MVYIEGNILRDREVQFLQLICSDMPYKQVAAKMGLSARSMDGYRDTLCAKLNVKTRTGLVLYAIKHGIFKIT